MGTFDDFLLPEDAAPKHAPERSADGLRWVPVRSLASRHRERIRDHLTALAEHDRYLRFGYAASDGQIAQYVDRIDFDRDEVFGVFNRRLELVAMAHLAYLSETEGAPSTSAEFGVSVSQHLRGKGIGARLFDHAMLHARNHGIDTLLIHALSENAPMLKIARAAGASVVRSGGDSDACLKLPPTDLASRLEAIVEGGAAELDYSLKRHAHQIDGLLNSLAEASSNLIKHGKGNAE